MEDATLKGYLAKHDRWPAFGGSDGAAYSVGVFVDSVPQPDGRFGAALVFVRWSTAGDMPVGHLETDYLTFGPTERAAKQALLELTLHDAKAQLEAAIATSAPPPPEHER